MRSVGKAVGIDPATIYYYFPSKEALLVEILESSLAQLLSDLQDAYEGDVPIQERFGRAVEAHVLRATRGNQALHDLCFNYLSDAAKKIVSKKRDMVDAIWKEIFHEALQASVLQVNDISLGRLHLITAMNGTYRWYKPGGRLDPQRIAKSLVDLYVVPVAKTRGERRAS